MYPEENKNDPVNSDIERSQPDIGIFKACSGTPESMFTSRATGTVPY